MRVFGFDFECCCFLGGREGGWGGAYFSQRLLDVCLVIALDLLYGECGTGALVLAQRYDTLRTKCKMLQDLIRRHKIVQACGTQDV